MTILQQLLSSVSFFSSIFKYSDVPNILDVPQSANFAILCGKYDCTSAVKPWCIMWMAEVIKQAGKQGYEQLICIAYLLDLPKEFNTVTSAQVLYYSAQLSYDTSASVYQLIPRSLMGLIRDRKSELQTKVTTEIELGVSSSLPMLQVITSDKCKELIVGQYLRGSYRVGLWPLPNFLKDQPVSAALDKLSQAKAPSRCGKPTCGFTCSSAPKAISQIIKQISGFFQSNKGMCLDCIKHGFKDSKSTCRYPEGYDDN